MVKLATIHCLDCKRDLSDDPPTMVWRAVQGWERGRSEGGTNHVAMREPQDAFLCDVCMRKRQRGLRAQEGLW